MLPNDALFQNALTVRQVKNIHSLEFEQDVQPLTCRVDFRQLVYVNGGTAQIASAEYSGPLQDGQAMICRAGQAHTVSVAPGQWAKVILVGFMCDNELLDRFSMRPLQLNKTLQEIVLDVQRENTNIFLPPYGFPYRPQMQVRTGAAYAGYQLTRLKMESFLIHLIRVFNQPEDEPRHNLAVVEKVHYFISKNFSLKISLDELSQRYNVNKNTLCTLFKRTYGITIIDYVNTVRVNRAKIFLRQDELNMTQIAELMGFTSVHYFSRIFKQYTGTSPTAYAKTLQK